MASDQHPDIESLFRKYLATTTTPQEVDRLLDYFGLDWHGDELRRLIRSRFEQELPATLAADRLDALVQRMDDAVLSQTTPASPPTVKRFRKWWPYAAAALLVASVAGWWAIGIGPSAISTEIADIQPGGNKATLTLANGRTIALSSEQGGIVVADGITYQDGSSVLGESIREETHELTNSQIHTLELTTPKGGTYSITLPDGSRVWLNANSTLKYPSRFAEDAREVILDGEAFFAVSHRPSAKRLPFRVMTQGQTVEVLGTQFNVSAYADEPETKTTLVEGRVRVEANGASLLRPGGPNSARNQHSLQLVPGEQGTLAENGLTKREVDTEPYTSWKSGRFTFDGKSFDQVMRELARWYDIEIRYEGGVPKKEFYGDAFRNNNLSILLSMLESAELEYRMDGRELTILNKEH